MNKQGMGQRGKSLVHGGRWRVPKNAQSAHTWNVRSMEPSPTAKWKSTTKFSCDHTQGQCGVSMRARACRPEGVFVLVLDVPADEQLHTPTRRCGLAGQHAMGSRR